MAPKHAGRDRAHHIRWHAGPFRPEHSPDFYYHYLSAQYEALRGLGDAGTQQNLSAGILKDVEVLVPPFDEQQAIAARLAVAAEWVRRSDEYAARIRQERAALLADLLTGKRRVRPSSTEAVS